ncbi:hypothetical protein QAD02_017435 [Eretmocerus hayati]|uniref:Uncharacterized protein n=1 Tax=Eretmocerus hayati TaxID=131215 RepID=A0ACC2PF13_9HYME|nr:hypothetical protein QAD02_017435 [Eretmocerus hayati]
MFEHSSGMGHEGFHLIQLTIQPLLHQLSHRQGRNLDFVVRFMSIHPVQSINQVNRACKPNELTQFSNTGDQWPEICIRFSQTRKMDSIEQQLLFERLKEKRGALAQHRFSGPDEEEGLRVTAIADSLGSDCSIVTEPFRLES